MGFPHSDIHGSKPALGSPWLFAECHVLHRLSVPRHPRNALMTLDRASRRDKPDMKHCVLQRSYQNAPSRSVDRSGACQIKKNLFTMTKSMLQRSRPSTLSTARKVPFSFDDASIAGAHIRVPGSRCACTPRRSTRRSLRSSLNSTLLVEPVGIEPTTSSLQS